MKISTPQIDSTDINSIHKVLKSNWISTSSNVVKNLKENLQICKNEILPCTELWHNYNSLSFKNYRRKRK